MNQNIFRVKGFVVWGLCALFFLYEFFLRTSIGTFQTPIMLELNLTSFQFSLLSTTVFFAIYAVMQIPVGFLVDKFGLKKALGFGCLACAIGCIGMAYSFSFPTAFFYRMLMGLGASFGFLGLLMSVNEWMPHKYLAVFIGLSQFIGTLGPMAAAGPLDSLVQTLGISWRQVLLYLGVIGLGLFVSIVLFVDNNRETAGQYTILHKPEKLTVLIKNLFARSQPWLIALLTATLYFTIEYLSDNEGRSLLFQKGITINSASYMITISWIGYAIGCPLLGYISDMVARRKPVMIFGAILNILAIIMIFNSSKKEILQISFFLLGIGASSQSIGYAIIAEQFKKKFIAVGFGLVNFIVTAMTAINAPFIGFLLDSRKVDILPSIDDYLIVYKVLMIISFIGLFVAVFFIKETYCKSKVDFTYLNPQAVKSHHTSH